MKSKLLPIDRLALVAIFSLTVITILLITAGSWCGSTCFLHQGPKVNYFSWADRLVGAQDIAFILGFDRPMKRQTVTTNLQITPPLPGKISWAGRRLAYTLTQPIPYGETYSIKLSQAKGITGDQIQPFETKVQSRDRAFAYLGTTGTEIGRLILYNWTNQERRLLTPENLIVTDFKFAQQGETIIFAAADKSVTDTLRQLQIYRVNTGLNHTETQPQIELLVNNQDYQNNQFDVSRDGEKVVVQRIKRDQPNDFGLWLWEKDHKLKPLDIQGGEFLIAPDSNTLAVTQGEGIALISLQETSQPLSFLPRFGRVLSFSPDGTGAVMVNFNTDNPELRFTRSLVYVNNRGANQELLNTNGSIIDCQFSPQATSLYCLLTDLIETDQSFQENPYFAAINLETQELIHLLKLPNYQDMNISVAPDGLGILFDQVITNTQVNNSSLGLQSMSYLFEQVTNSQTINFSQNLRTYSGAEILGGNLWMLIIPPTELTDTSQVSLEEIPFVGFRPQWAP